MSSADSAYLVFLGPPASGKGTQGRRLAESLAFSYLGTGGLLRGAMREKSDAGRRARPYLEKGRYVPDDIMLPLVSDWLDRQQGGWILDGFPRTLAQAEDLDDLMGDKSQKLIAVSLDVPEEELRRRVGGRVECRSCHWVGRDEEAGDSCRKCGGKMAPRADDDLDRFKKRYREFRELTLPLVDYYQQSARLLSVDGSAEPAKVRQDLADQLATQR